ncbi:MAG: phosphopentomutase [Clostridiales bacterium]|nr:phosphopentomutase [Clostridiales bacterium]
MKKRVILIVLDSVGCGALPDAAEFGDAGANTLGNIYKARGHLHIPHMTRLGLGNIEGAGLPGVDAPAGAFARCAEFTYAKDTTCGHWEMAGHALAQPFKTYLDGFPRELIDEFERRIGRKTIGNYAASGTQIIMDLGDAHVATGCPIVYTSADSVFQLAAHESVIPLAELYRMCEIARELLVGEYLVGRVIARPFTGTSGAYTRTENRRDYAMPPFADTILDALQREGHTVVGIGKIEDIFCNRGIDVVDHTKNNPSGISATARVIQDGSGAFVFVNLVDTDMLYGHRRNVEGYARALEDFDASLPELLDNLAEGDILMLTADHGCDPTHSGTDHTREYIPLLVYGKPVKPGVDLGTRGQFSDIGATIYEYLTGEVWREGVSFLKDIQV